MILAAAAIVLLVHITARRRRQNKPAEKKLRLAEFFRLIFLKEKNDDPYFQM